jgi:uncharacterized ParB-like nuclease family protein
MTKKLKLSEIVTDAGTQVRAGLNETTMAEYAEALADGAKFPPVIVFHDGSRYIAADGFHRIQAAVRSGATQIECDVRKGSKTDALKFALGCNAHHGLRRTNADKRHAVGLALREFPKASTAAIAEMCLVSNELVAEIRKTQPAEIGGLRPPPTRIGLDGRERTLPPPPMVRGEGERTMRLGDSATGRPAFVPRAGLWRGNPPTSDYGAAWGGGGGNGETGKRGNGEGPQWDRPGHPTGQAASPTLPPPPPSQVLDATGWAIPTQLIPLWQRADEVQEMLTSLSRVKGALRAAQENRDKLFAEVNFSSALSQLDQAWTDIKTAKPFAVCPTCQGQVPEKCTLCRGRGLISEHRWNTCVTREDKEFRVRAKGRTQTMKDER